MDKRFSQDSGVEAYTGNELLVKGFLEGGVNLITGYPGSPVADVFDVAQKISPYLKEHGILAELANNEALAGARLNGSQMADLRAVAIMKSVGYNVAADGLATGTLAKTGHKGGAVIVVGDDPWTDSTQVPQDSRRLADHIMIPVLEPSTYQEVKDWLKTAFELSAESDLYITYLITTNLADGGATVEVRPNQLPKGLSTLNRESLDSAQIQTDHTILLPPHTGKLEEEALQTKFPNLLKAARSKPGLNRIIPGRQKREKIGFISAGIGYSYLEQALAEMGMEGRFPILKLGMTYPLDPEAVQAICEQAETLVVVEEKRSFIERQVKECALNLHQSGVLKEMPLIWGKVFPEPLKGIPASHGLNPAVILKRLGPLFSSLGLGSARIDKELAFLDRIESYDVTIPARTPTFCPGCPHRDSSSVFLRLVKDFKDSEYMRKKHGCGPIDILFHGDAGCYSMLFFAPNAPLMHNYSGMGLGGGTGAGISPFTTNKSVGFLGDGTFFHSGLAGISDSVKNKQDICYVVLDNKTTAMTGHQPHPGVEENLMGDHTFGQNVEEVLKGVTRGLEVPIVRINPERSEDYREALEDMLMLPGVKFVVADKECGITYHSRKKRERGRELASRGYLAKETKVNVASSVCEYCLECTRLTGCPGLTIEDTLYGPKIQTDLSNCVSDKACARIKACPSFEEITILRGKKPARPAIPPASALKAPPPLDFEDAWRGYLCGIGGMGIGTATAVLVRAGMKHGYKVTLCDKKGLAIRNGGVYSHVTFSKTDKVLSPVIPYGKANLLLGVDILEAVRGIDPHFNLRIGSTEHTSCVVNNAKTPTILTLMGKDDFQPSDLEAMLRRYNRDYYGANLSKACQEVMGDTLYVNIMMLGVAFQRALLPVSLEDLEYGIRETFGKAKAGRNLEAFTLGRHMVVHPELYASEEKETLATVLQKKAKNLGGGRKARQFTELAWKGLAALNLDEEHKIHLVDRLYELIAWGGLDYAQQYLDRLLKVFRRDSAQFDYEATRMVLKQLFKVMAIKDEVYVAHLLTSPEKYERDAKRYGIDPAQGDQVVYKHINRPHFDIMGMKFEFNLNSRDWMLRPMKHLHFLRRLMPAWHAKEKAFRDWYGAIVDHFSFRTVEQYRHWLKLLELPEEVRGYREVRYPKMEIARRKAEEIFANLQAAGALVPEDLLVKPS
jgi:indolepyruvate ferredoxin oxidoreductase